MTNAKEVDKLIQVDLGCSNKKRPGFIGIDIVPHPCVDIVADVLVEGIPLESDTVDVLYSSHCLEHLPTNDIPFVWHEMHRILKKDARLFLKLPYCTSSKALTSISHVSYFSERTFIDSGFFKDRFKINKIRFNFTEEWVNKPQEEKEFARKHYFNVVFDFEVMCSNKSFIPWKQCDLRFSNRVLRSPANIQEGKE